MQHGKSIDDTENTRGQIPRLLGQYKVAILYIFLRRVRKIICLNGSYYLLAIYSLNVWLLM